MKHTEIPHELGNRTISINDKDNENRILEKGDKVIYAAIRRYMTKDRLSCPSISKIKEKTHCGQTRIYEAIDRLIKAGFVSKTLHKTPSGKIGTYYYFPKSEFDKHFEMFTDDFLDMEMPLNIKEYYMDIQQYLYDKESGVGKCSFSNSELSRKLGVSIPTVKKYNTYLIEHGYLEEEATMRTDEGGAIVFQKNFNLTNLNQAALWVQAVTKQVTANTQDIEQLKEDNEFLKEENRQMRQEINALKKEMSLNRNKTNEPLSIPF